MTNIILLLKLSTSHNTTTNKPYFASQVLDDVALLLQLLLFSAAAQACHCTDQSTAHQLDYGKCSSDSCSYVHSLAKVHTNPNPPKKYPARLVSALPSPGALGAQQYPTPCAQYSILHSMHGTVPHNTHSENLHCIRG